MFPDDKFRYGKGAARPGATLTLCLTLAPLPATLPAQNKSHLMAPRSQQAPMQAMMGDVREMRGLRGADLERTYLTRMLDHHQSGIDMAHLAVRKANAPGLRREGQRIIRDQTQEIGRMQALLVRFYSIRRTAKPDPRMQETMQKLSSLSGRQFDRAFVRDMFSHHETAILMSGPAIRHSPHAEVRRFAAKTAASNRASQARMRRALGGE